MRRLSEVAISECASEVRAACRRPIEPAALDTLFGRLKPNFERILDHPDGAVRWSDHGQRMRDNGRHVGALADFFGNHADVTVVGIGELTHAFAMVRAVCKVGAEDGPCDLRADDGPAANLLRALAEMPKP
ncbi:MAG TPA: hypothetical protein VI485_14710 [Vicinamibacterales bacterium]|nr:hypothetical protein [Vicinamibacterales bacterium]